MKRIIYTLVFLSLILNLTAQSNLEIVNSSKRWTYMEHQSWVPSNWVRFSYHIKLYQDTIINQINYLKIWESNDQYFSSWYPKGFIRSDTNGNVFLRNLANEEGLVYKFNVNPGDTFSVSNPFHIYDFIAEVAEVDQVYIAPANEYRKRVKIIDYEGISWGDEEYWIEGIGSMAGIITSGFHLYSLTGGEHDALCQWQNNSLVFSNPEFSSCFYLMVSNPEIKDFELVNIYPNPMVSQTRISLNLENEKNITIEIQDIRGKFIARFEATSSNDIILNRDQFINGVYVVCIKNNNEIIARKKLLVQ